MEDDPFLQMEDDPITVKTANFGHLKKARKRFLQRYKHQRLLSCLAGLYSCRWQRYQRTQTEPGQWCCKVRERVFSPVLAAAFCLSFIFLYLWGEAKNDYHNFDWYNYNSIGTWFLWSMVFLVVAALLFSYTSLLVILAICLLSASQELYLHWSHKIGTLFVLLVSIAALVLITLLWNEEWKILRLSFQITAPFFHVIAILIMVFLAWPVGLHVVQAKRKVLQVVILSPYLALLFFLLFIPLGLYSPCILEKGTLGPKPALIGHRGAPMVAPENTEMAFQKTIEFGAVGLETDVTISYDGIPFLMHDKTLTRTTDIGEVMPSAMKEQAAMFTWDLLEKLNAGTWFLKNRPFVEMPQLSKADEALARKQLIFKLSDFLKLANQENKLVIFDLYRPPVNHPYRDSWIHRILDVIQNESGIQPHLVLWLEDWQRSHVQSIVPGFQHTTGFKAPVEELLQRKIVKLNLDYRDMSSEDIRKYAEANITTNLYVVSELWLFSLAWCCGAHSVTTNTVHDLINFTQPSFLMTPQEYRSMWIVADVFGVILICLIFAIHWWREIRVLNHPSRSHVSLENGTYNKFGTELNRMPDVS